LTYINEGYFPQYVTFRTIRTNRMHYLLSTYFNNWPLHVSSRLTAHHQEVLLRIHSNWCMACVYVDWLLAQSCCTDIYRCTINKTLEM